LIIIAIIGLNLVGCGYKSAPYYEENPDKDVKIIIKQKEDNK